MVRVLLMARVSGLAVAALVLVWTFGFRTSFLPHPSSSNSSSPPPPTLRLDHLYSALHPVLMVIGFILLGGEAILAHRSLPGWSRSTRKSVHLSMQGAALGFGIFGIWAKFKASKGILANFYSLHSWMGLLCLFLFASQWASGFLWLWHRPEGRQTRSTTVPWHSFVGLYTYGLAVVTAETGLLEKLTFIQTRRGLSRRSMESSLVNVIGLALAVLAAFVVFAVVSPKHRHHLPSNVKEHDQKINVANKQTQ
ncbi:putative transmembrane ascorbate ferrireductase 4 [Iris pallida]|uniref:Transmembrane ascorbate ferrireductase 4 n=1 Tax=Iris pallida TaxID=29817 RepID=A0AAX6ETC3_IRIPA|nr:putative transmembrane ascorbate ferrireductase 4 [Iris pallida]